MQPKYKRKNYKSNGFPTYTNFEDAAAFNGRCTTAPAYPDPNPNAKSVRNIYNVKQNDNTTIQDVITDRKDKHF